jgi:hypothetical protein
LVSAITLLSVSLITRLKFYFTFVILECLILYQPTSTFKLGANEIWLDLGHGISSASEK